MLRTGEERSIIRHIECYIDKGFSIHPCCPGLQGALESGKQHHCSKPGKVPYEPDTDKHLANWQTPKLYPAGLFERWLAEGKDFNVGFLTGTNSGVIGVDLDNSESIAYFEKLVSCRINEIPTWSYSTGNGYRIIYSIPRDHTSFPSFNIRDGSAQIEILADGKQSVLPPSKHASGRRYKWDEVRSPFVLDEPLDCPEWILECIDNETVITSDLPDPIDWSEVVAKGIDEGGRNEGLTRVIGRIISPVPLDIDTIYQVASSMNKTMCHPPLPEHELRTIVKSLYRREGLQSSRGQDEAMIRRTMLKYGINRSDAVMMLGSLQ